MSEADYAMLVGDGVPAFDTVDSFRVTSTGTGSQRAITIAPGFANADGVRVTSDATMIQNLNAPSAGGVWILATLRRSWAPLRQAGIVFHAGPTTGSTGPAVLIPSAWPDTFARTVGTVTDQPIAWVFINSANATVSVFDLRLIRSGGTPVAISMEALAAGSQWLQNGAELQVQGCPLLSTTTDNGNQLLSGKFRKVGGVFGLVDDLLTYNKVGTSAAFAAILDSLQAYPGRINYGYGARVIDQGNKTDSTIAWRYVGGTSASPWRIVPSERMVCRAHDQAQQVIGLGKWNRIQWRTVDADPFGMAQPGSTEFLLPWNGLYELDVKAAVAGGAVPATSRVILKWQVGENGFEGEWNGQLGSSDSVPITLRSIVAGTAGTKINVAIFVDGATTASQALAYGSFAQWPTLSLRYLGDVA